MTFHFDVDLSSFIKLETARKPRKVTKAVRLATGNALAEYQSLHEKQWKEQYPTCHKDGMYSFELPTGKPSAKLTKMVKNFLEWNGHEANRIDTKGTAVIDKKAKPKFSLVSGKIEHSTKVNFMPTNTKTGTEDIAARLVHHKHPFGVPWAIEIKAGNDRQSPEQIKREHELKSKGLWYDVVKTFDGFYELYLSKIKLLDN